MTLKLEEAWEKRARTFKDKKESVMQQSFPSVLNEYVHKVHLQEIMSNMPKGKCTCLDIGCGYGRVAIEVINNNRDAYVYGIDISKTFIDLFNEKLKKKGKGVVGDIRKIPFQDKSFDYIYCIVSLMYVSKIEEQRLAISEILRVLKPGGKAVIIEPNTTGDNIIKLFGILPFILRKILKRKKVETYGFSFEWNVIDELVKKLGGTLIKKRGYPVFTISFFPVFVISKILPYFARFLLDSIYKIDQKIAIPRISNVITYVIEKPH